METNRTEMIYEREDLIKLNIKFMVETGEIADLLFLTGMGDDTDWELRARVFEEEIKRLNKKIEMLGGKSAPYILSKEDIEKSEKIKEEMKQFELENGDKIKEFFSKK